MNDKNQKKYLCNHRLLECLKKVKKNSLIKDFPNFFRIIVLEIIKSNTILKRNIVKMDKKIHKITENMKSAQKDIEKGKNMRAIQVLKKAEKKNEKLVKFDKNVRDPMVKSCKEKMKK